MSAYEGKELHVTAHLLADGLKVDVNIGPLGVKIEKTEGWMSALLAATIEVMGGTLRKVNEDLLERLVLADVQLIRSRHEIEQSNAKEQELLEQEGPAN